ncbi:hypothetical protein Hanom_Chr12g01151131 [Helianthus anomalus]
MRNEIVFKHMQLEFIQVLEEAKSLSYTWIKNRSKLALLTWEDWNRFNVFVCDNVDGTEISSDWSKETDEGDDQRSRSQMKQDEFSGRIQMQPLVW